MHDNEVNKQGSDIKKQDSDINIQGIGIIGQSHGSRARYYKSLAVIICFCIFVFGLMLANLLLPDRKISSSERRKLVQVPAFSREELLSGVLFEKYEKYFLDQFVMRDGFRGLKALTAYKILMQKDNNGIYVENGHIGKLEYPLDEKAILNAADKFNEVYDKYLQGMRVYYAIIPDKNYYLAAGRGYPVMDYDRLVKLMEQNVRNMEYINLFGELDIDDYYTGDLHWRQDRLTGIADMLLERMGNSVSDTDVNYRAETLYPFYGSYYGQAALPFLKPDRLVYLTNETIEKAKVYDHIERSISRVYITDKFDSVDPYDFFLSGPKSMLTITRAEAEAGVWAEAETGVWAEAETGIWAEAETGVWVEAETGVWAETGIWAETGAGAETGMQDETGIEVKTGTEVETGIEVKTGRELIIFRDSFGSSLAPLLIKGYDSITLIDLRYMAADILGDYIDFEDQDVLFLYNTMILNNSYMLK